MGAQLTSDSASAICSGFGSAHVGAAAGDGEDDALLAENINGAEHGVAADAVLLLQMLYGWQGTAVPLALGDPGSEDGGELLVGS